MNLMNNIFSKFKAGLFKKFISVILLLWVSLPIISGCLTFKFEPHVGTENNVEIKFETPIDPQEAIEPIIPTGTPIASSPTLEATSSLPTATKLSVVSTPTLGIGSTMIGKNGMVLLYVPAGKFTMGTKAEDALAECEKYRRDCQLDWYKDEEPPHSVELDAFWIDQTEVTNAMYAKCVKDGKCDPPGVTKIPSFVPTYPLGYSYYGNSEFDNYPVIYVSWNDAKAYCLWAVRRLPTEAEWEKAARGTDGRTYPWGNEGPNYSLVNYGSGYTTEVGKYLDGASPYGALDMAGNATEWVADWYSDTYYANSPISNPSGPDKGHSRVLRGGSWIAASTFSVRSTSRGFYATAQISSDVGFRCALSASH
jgi:eukaryotic-like serine/threonine-protein kinase